MENLLFTIGQQSTPNEAQYRDLNKITNEAIWNTQNMNQAKDFLLVLSMSAFNYGRIVGKQEERSRHKKGAHRNGKAKD